MTKPTTRRTKAPAQVKPGIKISGCSLSNVVNAETNEHTRAAVEALANAAAENARALAAIARALLPPQTHFASGIHLEGPFND